MTVEDGKFSVVHVLPVSNQVFDLIRDSLVFEATTGESNSSRNVPASLETTQVIQVRLYDIQALAISAVKRASALRQRCTFKCGLRRALGLLCCRSAWPYASLGAVP